MGKTVGVAFLSSRLLLAVAERARDHSEKDSHLALASIVFAAASFEGLFAELGLLASGPIGGSKEAERAMGRFVAMAAERSFKYAGTLEKVRLYCIALDAGMPDFGAPPLQGLADLVTLRNYIIHIKPERVTVIGDAEAQEQDVQRIVRGLVQRKIIPEPSPSAGAAATYLLGNVGAARWACQTAIAARVYLGDLLPKGAHLQRIFGASGLCWDQDKVR